MFYFHPYLGKIPILTNIFQMGWNHQPVECYLDVQETNFQLTFFCFFQISFGGKCRRMFTTPKLTLNETIVANVVPLNCPILHLKVNSLDPSPANPIGWSLFIRKAQGRKFRIQKKHNSRFASKLAKLYSIILWPRNYTTLASHPAKLITATVSFAIYKWNHPTIWEVVWLPRYSQPCGPEIRPIGGHLIPNQPSCLWPTIHVLEVVSFKRFFFKVHPRKRKKNMFVHPGRLTWNLKITQLKRKISSKPSFSGSMLIFQGVSFCAIHLVNFFCDRKHDRFPPKGSFLKGKWESTFFLVNLPSRELTYPIKNHFWGWFSFSQGGIC